MNERSAPENAFGLRWIQDDDQGRLVYKIGGADYRSLADAIRILGLGCDEATLKASLDRFSPHIRIHGGYAPSVGEPVVRFTITWEPGSVEAVYTQTKDSPEEGMSGKVELSSGETLKDVLRGLLIPDAEDIVSQGREEGKATTMKDVDFWIGNEHFKVSDTELS
jgi:hypothetical protein